MYAAERSVVVTLKQANDIAEVGLRVRQHRVIIDAFHVWWDPDAECMRSNEREDESRAFMCPTGRCRCQEF